MMDWSVREIVCGMCVDVCCVLLLLCLLSSKSLPQKKGKYVVGGEALLYQHAHTAAAIQTKQTSAVVAARLSRKMLGVRHSR